MAQLRPKRNYGGGSGALIASTPAPRKPLL